MLHYFPNASCSGPNHVLRPAIPRIGGELAPAKDSPKKVAHAPRPTTNSTVASTSASSSKNPREPSIAATCKAAYVQVQRRVHRHLRRRGTPHAKRFLGPSRLRCMDKRSAGPRVSQGTTGKLGQKRESKDEGKSMPHKMALLTITRNVG